VQKLDFQTLHVSNLIFLFDDGDAFNLFLLLRNIMLGAMYDFINASSSAGF